MTKLTIKRPNNFDLRTAARGHGWYDLAPFESDDAKNALSHVLSISDGYACSLTVTQRGDRLNVEYDSDSVDTTFIRSAVRRMLRMDEDLDEFYSLTDKRKDLRWIRQFGAGRLLRSPSVFEDLVKTICTTNCTWSLTKVMVNNIVEKLGIASPSGRKAFPDPKSFAAVDAEFFRTEIRAGYRSEYLAELGQRIASGDLDVESFYSDEVPVDQLKKKLLGIKGVGNYAAEHMLKMLGHYDHLALDSWIRAEYSKLHRNGDKCSDAEIASHYDDFGRWKGLAVWCDVTRSWFNQSLS